MRILLILPLIVFLSSCSAFDSTEEEPPLPGERLSILDLQEDLVPVEAANLEGISVPTPIPNNEWSQNGRTPSHIIGNLEVTDVQNIEQIWRSDIGEGRTARLPLITQPVVGNGKVFTIDTKSSVRAFNAQTGKSLWSENIRPEGEDESVIAGGLAYNDNKLFVSGGYNEVLALNAETGEILWRRSISAGSRAAPNILNNRVFVKTLNNNIVALNAMDGTPLWEYEGVGEVTGLLGTATPAVDEQIVVAPFSSGDVAALRIENGSVIWTDRLINNLQLSSLSALADIRGLPVIENDTIYAVSFGGKFVAIDKTTGIRKWAKDISSSETPLIVGNTIYVMEAENRMIALNKETGDALWIKQLEKYENPEKKRDRIFWSGPLMINGKLMTISNNGIMSLLEPQTGEFIKQYNLKIESNIPAVIAGGTIFIVSANGNLIAYR
ncbi:MAG: PQQ-binding-like beta-propeller repeat protein [Pseudomonadota bacterium]